MRDRVIEGRSPNEGDNEVRLSVQTKSQVRTLRVGKTGMAEGSECAKTNSEFR